MTQEHDFSLPAKADLRDCPSPGRVLLVGARKHLRNLAGSLEQAEWSSWPVVGIVDASGRGRQIVVHPAHSPVPILGRLDQLSELVERSRATDILVALAERPSLRLRPNLKGLASRSVRVHWVNPNLRPGADVLQRPPIWALDTVPWPLRVDRIAKRLIDVVLALLALILLFPLFLIVAALIVVTTGKPIFYTQERIGQGGNRFRIVKFRSMRVDAEQETGPIWASFHDTRCTRIGDWLRSTNIDELPQLFNVIMGDMSLVGPRPERPMFVDRFRAEMPDYEYRHAVPAGMTGWAQVHGWRGRTSLRKRLQYDLDYIRHRSVWMDLRILAMTIQHVLVGRIRWGGGVRWLRGRRRR